MKKRYDPFGFDNPEEEQLPQLKKTEPLASSNGFNLNTSNGFNIALKKDNS